MPGTAAAPRYRHHSVDVGDVRLHVAEVAGQRPMVMLHGIGMDWRVWQAMPRRLAPSFHLYLVDLRGHGESDKPQTGYTVGHYAADVEELVDRLGLREAVLVGSSLGGVAAAATELPLDMVSHKVLVDPPLTAGPLRNPDTFETILRLKRERPDRLAAFLQESNPGIGRFLARTMAEMWMEAADGVIETPLSDVECYFAIDPALEATEQPVLLLQADAERGQALTDADAQRVLRLLPRSSLVHIPGSGHAIHATNPKEFTDLVTRFAGTR